MSLRYNRESQHQLQYRRFMQLARRVGSETAINDLDSILDSLVPPVHAPRTRTPREQLYGPATGPHPVNLQVR